MGQSRSDLCAQAVDRLHVMIVNFAPQCLDDFRCQDDVLNAGLLSVIAGRLLESTWLQLAMTGKLKCRRFFRLEHYKVVLVDQVRIYLLPAGAAAAWNLYHGAVEADGPIHILHDHHSILHASAEHLQATRLPSCFMVAARNLHNQSRHLQGVLPVRVWASHFQTNTSHVSAASMWQVNASWMP